MIARLLLVTIALAAVASNTLYSGAVQEARSLFTWVGDGDRADSDFLAVVDLTPSEGRSGEIVATHPVGEKALWPHHTEHEFASDGLLFATGFAGNRTFIFRPTGSPQASDRRSVRQRKSTQLSSQFRAAREWQRLGHVSRGTAPTTPARAVWRKSIQVAALLPGPRRPPMPPQTRRHCVRKAWPSCPHWIA